MHEPCQSRGGRQGVDFGYIAQRTDILVPVFQAL